MEKSKLSNEDRLYLKFHFLLSARRTNASTYLLDRHGIIIESDEYFAYLKKTDDKEVLKAIEEVSGFPSQFVCTPKKADSTYKKNLGILCAVRIIKLCDSLMKLLDKLQEKSIPITLEFLVKFSSSVGTIEKYSTSLTLSDLGKKHISEFQGQKKKHSKKMIISQIEALARKALSGPLRKFYVWDTPKRKNELKIKELAADIAGEVGRKPGTVEKYLYKIPSLL